MDEQVKRLEAEINAKDEALNQLKAKAKAFAEAMTGEKRQLESTLAATKAELTDLKTKAKLFADNVKAQIVADKDKMNALEKLVQMKEQELTALQTQAKSGDMDMGQNDESKQKELTALEMSLRNSFEMEKEAMKNEWTQKQNEMMTKLQEEHAKSLQNLQESMKATNSETSRTNSMQLQAEKARLEREFNASRNQLESQLREVKDCHAKEIQTISQRASELDAQLAKTTEQLNTATQQLTTASQQARDLEANASAQSMTQANQLAQMEQNLSAISAILQQLVPMAMTTDCLAMLQSLQQEWTMMQSDYSKLQQQLQEAASNLAASQTQAATLMSSLNSTTADYQNQIKSLQEQLSSANANVQSLQSRLAEETSAKDGIMNQLNEVRMELSHEKSQHKSQSSDLAAIQTELTTTKDALQALEGKYISEKASWSQLESSLTKEKQELAGKHDKYMKEEEEKKAKVKQYVQALTVEKQKAVESITQLTTELENARKSLQEKDGMFEKRMNEVKSKTMDKFSEHERVIQKSKEDNDRLVDQIKKLESEIKLLQTKKKEAEDETMESLKKKRLAAKAETQKLANDLEAIQKRAAMLVDITGNKCTQQSKHIDLLQEKVLESIHALSHQKKCDLSNLNELCHVVDSPRMSTNLPGPPMGLNKVDDEVTRVFDKMTALSNVTERLCDLMLEEGDMSFKDIVLERVVKQFSACFAHPPYQSHNSKSDEAELLHQRSSSSTQPPDSPVA
ncbi:sporangia induced hypothetical protein [Thraustotheca clavata]|uniref:Uncharacterized protein n=1 Tax=Thraustotheca clavata TaxID=74557 RepID=A0A1V9ZFZ1_9STRA|nr:sporangia induced hypothetical protein [Thraustotheca clavata]